MFTTIFSITAIHDFFDFMTKQGGKLYSLHVSSDFSFDFIYTIMHPFYIVESGKVYPYYYTSESTRMEKIFNLLSPCIPTPLDPIHWYKVYCFGTRDSPLDFGKLRKNFVFGSLRTEKMYPVSKTQIKAEYDAFFEFDGQITRTTMWDDEYRVQDFENQDVFDLFSPFSPFPKIDLFGNSLDSSTKFTVKTGNENGNIESNHVRLRFIPLNITNNTVSLSKSVGILFRVSSQYTGSVLGARVEIVDPNDFDIIETIDYSLETIKENMVTYGICSMDELRNAQDRQYCVPHPHYSFHYNQQTVSETVFEITNRCMPCHFYLLLDEGILDSNHGNICDHPNRHIEPSDTVCVFEVQILLC